MNIFHRVIEGSFEAPDKMPTDTDQTSNHNEDTSSETVQDPAKVSKGKGAGKHLGKLWQSAKSALSRVRTSVSTKMF